MQRLKNTNEKEPPASTSHGPVNANQGAEPDKWSLQNYQHCETHQAGLSLHLAFNNVKTLTFHPHSVAITTLSFHSVSCVLVFFHLSWDMYMNIANVNISSTYRSSDQRGIPGSRKEVSFHQ